MITWRLDIQLLASFDEVTFVKTTSTNPMQTRRISLQSQQNNETR